MNLSLPIWESDNNFSTALALSLFSAFFLALFCFEKMDSRGFKNDLEKEPKSCHVFRIASDEDGRRWAVSSAADGRPRQLSGGVRLGRRLSGHGKVLLQRVRASLPSRNIPFWYVHCPILFFWGSKKVFFLIFFLIFQIFSRLKKIFFLIFFQA